MAVGLTDILYLNEGDSLTEHFFDGCSASEEPAEWVQSCAPNLAEECR